MTRWLLLATICGLPTSWDCERQTIGVFRDEAVCMTAGLTMPIDAQFKCVQYVESIPLPRPRPTRQ